MKLKLDNKTKEKIILFSNSLIIFARTYMGSNMF